MTRRSRSKAPLRGLALREALSPALAPLARPLPRTAGEGWSLSGRGEGFSAWLAPALFLAAILLPGLAFGQAPASQAAASEDPPPPEAAPSKHETLFFYLQGNPAGLAFSYDIEQPAFGPFKVGVNAAYYVYAAAAELSLRYRYLGGLIDVLAGVGAEGGSYYQIAPGAERPASEDEAGPKAAGLKTFARAEAKINLKLPRVWLYNRTTTIFRHRDFVEFDARRDLVAEGEFSLGQANALLFRVWGDPKAPIPKRGYNREGWAYLEYTGEFVTTYQGSDSLSAAQAGREPAISRPSAGLIAYAPFGWSGVTVNLDIYYSLLQGALDGPGGQLLVWWEF
jgi:hypothetical protein